MRGVPPLCKTSKEVSLMATTIAHRQHVHVPLTPIIAVLATAVVAAAVLVLINQPTTTSTSTETQAGVATAAWVSVEVLVVVGWLIRTSTAAATTAVASTAMMGVSGTWTCCRCAMVVAMRLTSLEVLQRGGTPHRGPSNGSVLILFREARARAARTGAAPGPMGRPARNAARTREAARSSAP